MIAAIGAWLLGLRCAFPVGVEEAGQSDAMLPTGASGQRRKHRHRRCATLLINWQLPSCWSSARNKEFEHLPKRIENWSPTSLQQRLVKTGGRLVKHARYYWLMLAEGHLTRVRFAAMLRRIALLSLPAN
jgi:hypothetical protein